MASLQSIFLLSSPKASSLLHPPCSYFFPLRLSSRPQLRVGIPLLHPAKPRASKNDLVTSIPESPPSGNTEKENDLKKSLQFAKVLMDVARSYGGVLKLFLLPLANIMADKFPLIGSVISLFSMKKLDTCPTTPESMKMAKIVYSVCLYFVGVLVTFFVGKLLSKFSRKETKDEIELDS